MSMKKKSVVDGRFLVVRVRLMMGVGRNDLVDYVLGGSII